jgi:hypothetical protein
MQTAQILKHPLKTEWAVIAPWSSQRNKSEKDIQSCQRAVKVVIESAQHYGRSNYTSPTKDRFYVTSEKAYSLLVSYIDSNGETIYAVIPPANFMGTAKEYDDYWIPENARRQAIREENDRLRAIQAEKQSKRWDIERERQNALQAESERLADSIRESVVALLGARASGVTVHPKVQGEWKNLDTEYESYTVTQAGEVRIEMTLFQKLLEKAMN